MSDVEILNDEDDLVVSNTARVDDGRPSNSARVDDSGPSNLTIVHNSGPSRQEKRKEKSKWPKWTVTQVKDKLLKKQFTVSRNNFLRLILVFVPVLKFVILQHCII